MRNGCWEVSCVYFLETHKIWPSIALLFTILLLFNKKLRLLVYVIYL